MYYEAQVVFVEEIPTKNGVREKKTRRAFLVPASTLDCSRRIFSPENQFSEN